MSPREHVEHTSWCAHHYVWSLSLEFLYFITKIGPANAGMACCPHVVTESEDDFLDLWRWRQETEDNPEESHKTKFPMKVK